VSDGIYNIIYGYTFYITIKIALHVNGTFVGREKKYKFNIKHKIIIIPVTKLKYDSQKPKHVVKDTHTDFIITKTFVLRE
jgi:hypothetical protein